jgi:3-phosphoshikimate 1-carboxyvinyltransferase
VLRGYAPGADCRATLACIEALGAAVVRAEATVTVIGRGVGRLSSPAGILDALNSGTTTRLLTGVLAGHPFTATITGDDSLRRRPMRRVIVPLTLMGARIGSTNGCLPMTIEGGPLRGIDYHTEVPSAQVKSAILLAGLHASGVTRVTESAPTRNHTEVALSRFGADVTVTGSVVELRGGQTLHAVDLEIPGDLSSAAFWAVAAAAMPGSSVELPQVGLNPTRRVVLDVLQRAGAEIEVDESSSDGGEPVGCVRVRHAGVRPITVSPGDVPGLIDELPALAALATHGGEITVTGAAELRVKESDRISALVAGLRALGADADELPDGFHVNGSRRLAGGVADAVGDHRLAMSFAIAALGARGPSTILGAESVDVSYPGFFGVLSSLTI